MSFIKIDRRLAWRDETPPAIPLPVNLFPFAILQPTLLGCDNSCALRDMVCGPDLGYAELEWTLDSVRQADANAPDLLPQELRLWFYNEPVVRPHEIIPFDHDSLPMAGPFREQPMLMQVRRLDRLRLQVYKVCPPVGLDPHGKVGVGVNVPYGLAKNRRGLVGSAKRRVAAALDVGPALRERRGDSAVESRVAGRGRRLDA